MLQLSTILVSLKNYLRFFTTRASARMNYFRTICGYTIKKLICLNDLIVYLHEALQQFS